MPITYAEIEELILQACRDFKTQENPNIAGTARKYSALKDHVYRRWMGLLQSYIDKESANRILDNTAE
jgi:hypothetical protein